MKKHLVRAVYTLLLISCLLGIVLAGFGEQMSDPCKSFPFYEITYTYDSEGADSTLTSGFVYNDGMFLRDENTLSPDLAKIGVALSVLAYDRSDLNAVLSSDEMGFTVVDNSSSYDKVNNLTINDNNYVAYTISHKTINYQGNEYIIYCVPVKGTSGNAEWYSNFELGEGDTHRGFSESATPVYSDLLMAMLEDTYANDRTIVYLTGHSRGAAVANLVAGWLTDRIEDLHVMAYTYACPSVSRTADTTMKNIYNFNHPGDLIPLLPMQEEGWDYKRYGVSIEAMESSCLDNLGQQFVRLAKKQYTVETSPTRYKSLLSLMVPTLEDYQKPVRQIVFNWAAYLLGGHTQSTKSEVFAKCGYDVADYTIQQIMESDPSTWAEVASELLLGEYAELLTFIRDNAEVVAELTTDDYANFYTENTTTISRIEKITGIALSSPYAFLASENLMQAAIDTVYEFTDKVGDSWNLFFDDSGKIMDKVTYGHTPLNYVAWINSMYYGYEGWYSYESDEPIDVVLDDRFSNIGSYCFRYCTGIRSLTMSDSVGYLGDRICDDASSLEKLVLNGYFDRIEPYTFRGCGGLTKLVIPEQITRIGDGAFEWCSGIESVTLPASIVFDRYNTWAFGGCSGIKYVRLTGTGDMAQHESYYSSCTPWYAGSNAGNAVTVEIDEGITSISEDAFYGCKNLVSVSIPESVTSIGSYAFYNCSGLSGVELPDSLTEIGSHIFRGCTSLQWDRVKLPKTMTSISNGMFYDCTGLTELEIPEHITRIESYAFRGCTGLTELVIPDNVTSIGDYAFYNCSGIESVTLPASIVFDGNNAGAFGGCSGITYVRLTGTGDMAQHESYYSSCTPWYAGSNAGNAVTVEIDEGITSISVDAFYGCKNLVSVSIPESVTSIGSDAFSGCSGLKTVNYSGNKNAWSAIKISSNNDYLLNAEIIFAEVALVAPTVTVTLNGSDKPVISWTVVEGAEKYELWRATSKSGTYTKLATLTTTTATNNNVTEGVTYYYKVRAVSGAEKSEFSEIVTITVPEKLVLTAPAVTVTNNAATGKNVISWTAVAGAEKYEIWGCTTKNGSYSKLGTVTGTSVTHSSATAGKTYYYKVRAIAGTVKGTASAAVGKTCDLARPVVTASNSAGSGKIVLTWAAISGADKYEIYRSDSKDGVYTKLGTVTGTSATISSAKPGETWYFRVKAIYSANSGADSAASVAVGKTCDCARPTLTVTLNAKGKPALSWGKIEGAVKYEIWASTSKNGTYTKLGTVTGTSVAHSSAKAGKTYYYKVMAIASSSAANSAYSAIKSVTVG